MAESQNIEWKASWRDEYLKWVCGFANAQGGKIYIGTNDNGDVIGLKAKDVKELMENLPNKIQTLLGIVADVNLLNQNGLDYIEIVVKPSAYPINYKGEYHYRSGSTKQQLNGASLTEFLVSKTGITWDSIPMEGVTFSELDRESFEIFRREALRTGRMQKKDLDIDDEQLLENLGLLSAGRLKRSAVLLFHRNPEKYITGAYVKVGYFLSDADLKHQDMVTGSLMMQADRIIEMIYLKYLKADISYEKETRIETYPFPREGVREAVYNALIHKNYADGIPIQISIYEDKMYIGNGCIFPSDWTVDMLFQKHNSRPLNPEIANGFYRAGLIESWGRGIEKICEACRQHGIPNPEYTIHANDMMVKLDALKIGNKASQKRQSDALNGALEKKIVEMLVQNPKITQSELAEALNISRRTVQRLMLKMVQEKVITRVGSKKSGYWKICQ